MVGRLTTMEVPPLRHLDVNVGVGVFGLEGRFSFDRPQALSVERSSGVGESAASACACISDMSQWHTVTCISDMYQ